MVRPRKCPPGYEWDPESQSCIPLSTLKPTIKIPPQTMRQLVSEPPPQREDPAGLEPVGPEKPEGTTYHYKRSRKRRHGRSVR